MRGFNWLVKIIRTTAASSSDRQTQVLPTLHPTLEINHHYPLHHCSHIDIRARNEYLRRFHKQGECTYKGFLLVESAYYSTYKYKTRQYAKEDAKIIKGVGVSMNGLAGLSGLSAVSGLGGRRNLESSSSRGGTGHTHMSHGAALDTCIYCHFKKSQNGLKRLFRQIFFSSIFFLRVASGYLITLRNRWAGMHGGLCNTLKIFVTLFTHHPFVAVLPCTH